MGEGEGLMATVALHIGMQDKEHGVWGDKVLILLDLPEEEVGGVPGNIRGQGQEAVVGEVAICIQMRIMAAAAVVEKLYLCQ